jgi:dynein heavy chain, axonemal
MLMAFHLEKRWKKLFSSALYRSKTLHSTKVKFSQMTANDIEKFKQEVSLLGYQTKLKAAQNVGIYADRSGKSMTNIL